MFRSRTPRLPGRTRDACRWAASLLLLGLPLAGCQVRSTPPPPPPPATAEPAPSTDSALLLDSASLGEEASLVRNFYFVLDGSGSMRNSPGGGCHGDQRFGSKLEGAQWAIQTFLEKVPEDVNIGLYIFDRRDRSERVPLATDNRDGFLREVQALTAGGGTPLAEAIRFGTQQLVEQYQRQLGYGEYRLVVVTDGQADGIPGAARYAEKRGIPIYAIGLCIDQNHPLRQHAVSYRAADNFADLAQGLEETLAELPSFDATEFDLGAD